jgi:hypothetical protein
MRLERGAQPPSDIVEVEAIRSALSAHESAAAAAKASDRELVLLERRGRHEAEQADAEELAVAIEAGKAPPKPKHVAEYEKQLEDGRRTASATKLVEARRWQTVLDAFAKHGAELEELTNRQIEQARSDYLEAVDDLERRHATLAAALSWKTFFAAPSTTMGAGVYRANGAGGTIKTPQPHPLDDTRILLADVLEAMRWIGTERPTPPSNPHQALVAMQTGTVKHAPPSTQRTFGFRQPDVVQS